MAKVKIQGHASGTGVITLTAPNTSTDRTVTLPDADVTLGADATKLPLAGGTLTGNLLVQSASTGATASTDADDLVIEGTNGGISILNATSGQGNIFFGDSGDNDIGKIAYNHTANTMYFITNGGTRASLTPDGLTFNSDTAAANALDDYEEGTYTPVFKDTSDASMTGSLINALYTKIGRQVTVNVYYAVGDSQNGSLNTMTLPFNQTGSGRGAGSITTYACPHANKSNDIYLNGGSKVAFWQVRDDATSIAMAVDDGSELILSITYMTA